MLPSENRERSIVVTILFVIGALVLLFNLLYLQILNNDYGQQAQSRTLTKRTIIPPRGIISDREGRLCVVNEPAYELEVIVNELHPDMDIISFCGLLGISPEAYDSRIDDIQKKRYFQRSLPMRFMSNIEPEVFTAFQEHLYRFPGFYPIIQNKRGYPIPNAAHVLGFIGEVNDEDLKKADVDFDIGDYKGVSGLERSYDKQLRGIKGLEFLLKDNIGREVEAFQNGALDTMAIKGEDITATLDISLQSLGELLMQNKRGSIVALEPKSGEVLAMVSSPTYDPNLLSLGRQRNISYLELLSDTINRPFFDRSIQAKYPPGSIFKPILSLIALQEETTYSSRSMVCSGEYIINERRGFVQGCRDHPKPINMATALQYSCNTYYYQVMREFINQFGYRTPERGLDLLNEHLEKFGIGRRLGVDLANESSGFSPSSEYYTNIYRPQGFSWRATYILSLGIGQGELELTTLQMANLAAIIANRGYYIPPHLVQKFSSGQPIPTEYSTKNVIPIDSVHFESVIDGMERVIHSGTGYMAYIPGISVCGKTGTSQNPHGVDHSVFFAFAPKDDPQIAIAVYVENAGGGGALAAPIGGLMIESYINGEVHKRRENLKERLSSIDLIHIP